MGIITAVFEKKYFAFGAYLKGPIFCIWNVRDYQFPTYHGDTVERRIWMKAVQLFRR
jgi:hypothetical protein